MTSSFDLANALRFLSMDAVQQARSGHPGAPMGMADMAQVLWCDFLRHNPGNPRWPGRDRFVLSNGHASMLLYSLLHLSGYELGIEDLRKFRQLHSRTPGHPEYGLTPGVETTTGPLGQGLANGVGMALAERLLAARYNRGGHQPVDHHTYVFAGDGCLMEGISYEAASLAGTWGLGRLIVLYDQNGISIDGEVSGWFTENVPERFRACGWHVVPEVDGHDAAAVGQALTEARARPEAPSLLCCQTVIGYGAPRLRGTAKVHGAPMGEEEVAAARRELGWSHPPFEIPPAVRQGWDARARGAEWEAAWRQRLADYRREFPGLAAELERCWEGRLPEGFAAEAERLLARMQEEGHEVATRRASKMALDALAPMLPELVGGSADLSDSNQSKWAGAEVLAPPGARSAGAESAAGAPQTAPAQPEAGVGGGNYLHYGVREFAMAAIVNGMACHGGIIPFGATFLTFADYARNGLRMAALMRCGSIFVFSHDSIGLGEDGPTHQPVEHLNMLRTTPGLVLWRPGDGVETAAAWRDALSRRDGPTALALSRQGLPHQQRSPEQLAAIGRGGYVLLDGWGVPELIFIATGSELQLAMAAARQLLAEGRQVRVVSMPSVEVFEAQDAAWREEVLPARVGRRLVIEAGHPAAWHRYAPAGRVLGLEEFGASAPGPQLLAHLGFTEERVLEQARDLLDGDG